MHGPLTLALALTLAVGLPVPDERPPKDDPPPKVEQPDAETAWDFLAAKYDKDGDGVITRKEYGGPKDRWQQLDRDGDGRVDRAEIEQRGRARKANPAKKKPVAPKLGQRAPTFELELLEDVDALPKQQAENEAGDEEGKKKGDKKEPDAKKEEEPRTIALADFRGEKPVALLFGSYT